MADIRFFLNEISCKHIGFDSPIDIERFKATVEALRTALKHFDNASLTAHEPKLKFWRIKNGYFVIGETPAFLKEDVLYLKNQLEQAPFSVPAHPAIEIYFNDTSGMGLTHAFLIESIVFSFQGNGEFEMTTIPCKKVSLGSQEEPIVDIRNISSPNHLAAWHGYLEEKIKFDFRSNTICEFSGFSVVMYPNDHQPAHLHIKSS